LSSSETPLARRHNAGLFRAQSASLAPKPDAHLALPERRQHPLEAVGFLERALAPSGSRYKATEEGLRRKPILYIFGSEYGPLFLTANNRAKAARGGDQRARRGLQPSAPPRPSVVISEARPLKGPKSKSGTDPTVLMGPLRQKTGIPPEPSVDPRSARIAARRSRLPASGSPSGMIGRGRVALVFSPRCLPCQAKATVARQARKAGNTA
jgi:hypothetical protein